MAKLLDWCALVAIQQATVREFDTYGYYLVRSGKEEKR